MGASIGMSGMTFATIFFSGCAVIALWINVRFPKLCPEGLRQALIHMVVGTLALDLIMPLGNRLAEHFATQPATRLLPVFLLILPALTYWLLGVSWMIRLTQSLMGGRIR